MKPANPTSGQGVVAVFHTSHPEVVGCTAQAVASATVMGVANNLPEDHPASDWLFDNSESVAGAVLRGLGIDGRARGCLAHAKEQAAGVIADRQSFDAGWQYGFSDGMSEGTPGYQPRPIVEMFEEFCAALRDLEAEEALAPAPASSVGESQFSIDEREDDMLIAERHWQFGWRCIARRPKLMANNEWRPDAQRIVAALSTRAPSPEHGELASLVEALAKAHSLSINKGTSVVIDFDDPAEGFALYNAMFPFTVLSASSGGEG